VECGVWRGGMIAGIADIMGRERDYFLFDSFKGLPPAKAVDGPAALAWQSDTTSPSFFDNCSAPLGAAKSAMEMSSARRVSFLEGWFDDTVPSFKSAGGIALLRLDADWYESTMLCLKYLMPQVNEGGLVIVDDYYTWDGCAKAVHDFLGQTASTLRISRYNNDVCLLA
jgi:O-methyltransferase